MERSDRDASKYCNGRHRVCGRPPCQPIYCCQTLFRKPTIPLQYNAIWSRGGSSESGLIFVHRGRRSEWPTFRNMGRFCIGGLDFGGGPCGIRSSERYSQPVVPETSYPSTTSEKPIEYPITA